MITDEKLKAFQNARATGQDISMFLQKGSWKDNFDSKELNKKL